MMYRHLRTHLIVAPSTSVGKSIFSTGLSRASLALGERVAYLKPVGTGSGDGDDEAHLRRFAPGVKTSCLFHFDEPVSPHLAVERAATSLAPTAFPTDDEFAAAVAKFANGFAQDTAGHRSSLYIESAGGVHSPTLSGSSQLDAFRPLLPPTILIASHELGGISTTISAYESLLLRGYDVDAVLIFREDYYANHEYLAKFFAERQIRVGVVDTPPPRVASSAEDGANLDRYYSSLSEGERGVPPLQNVVTRLQQVHLDRMSKLATAPRRTLDSVWWPFSQHGAATEEKEVMVIDSATGDFFNVFSAIPPPATSTPSSSSSEPTSSSLLSPVLDGSASWWTQCLGHANPALTLAAAQASGRYGHVLFPNATSLPSLTLAERLLKSVGDRWASRVFYSDDGSTGMEVALKMALRSYAVREGLDRVQSSKLAVLGLSGSYHGDTIGAMDACEGSVYSERIEWYQGRGHWFEAPTVKIEKGKPVVRSPQGNETTFSSLSEVYDVDRRFKEDQLADVYRKQIEDGIAERYAKGDGIRFGALILEPVVMGAGGMLFVDPLFQRVLIDVVRTNRTLFPSALPSSEPTTSVDGTPTWAGLPVIFDEVFVGLRRLGRVSSTSFLGSNTLPDIGCYAKILTGGLVPMAVTIASDAVFQAFWGKEKVDSLLHGHSYTAHPIGCSVGNKTLQILDDMDSKGAWDEAKSDWTPKPVNAAEPKEVEVIPASEEPVWSLWSTSFVNEASSLPHVEGVMAMGTVLAVYLKAADGAGYQSTAAASLLHQLRYGAPTTSDSSSAVPGGLPFNIHARPLGNVVYFMTSLTSKPTTLRAVEGSLLSALKSNSN